MPKSDGSVIFSVELEDKGAEKEIARLKNKMRSLSVSNEEQAAKKTALEEQLAAVAARADEAKAKLAALTAERDRLKSITPAAGEEYMTAGGRLPGVEEQIKEQQTAVKELDAELKKVDTSLIGVNEKMRESADAIERAKTQVAGLREESDRHYTSTALFHSKLNQIQGEYKKLYGKAEQTADSAERTAGGMGRVKKETEGADGAAGQLSKSMEKFTNRVTGLIKRVFVFTLITKALNTLRGYLWETIKSNDQATAAVARLKGAMLTLAQPIVNVVVPAFTKLVNILAKVAAYAANVVSKLFGTTATKSAGQAKRAQEAKKAAEGLEDESEAIEDVGKASKEAQKQLAGFDELNILSADDSEDAADKLKDEVKGLADTADSTGGIEPDFSGVIERELGKVEALVGAALIAVGAILTFTGVNVPLGLALMAAGLLLEFAVVKENWGAISEALQGPLGALVGIVGASLLVIGAVIAFSGANLGLGIALMIAGAIALVTAAAVNWDTITAYLQGAVGVITAILSASLLAIGAVMTFSGASMPLGIGLMILGAAGLAAAAAANWGAITSILQGTVGAITGILGGAFLVVGAIFTFSGAAVPLGLGLMFAGAAGLASSMAANWGFIKDKLSGELGNITTIVAGSLLAIGAILCLSGVVIPLGIALIAAGAAGLVTVGAVNWGDTILGHIRSGWAKITGWFTGTAEPEARELGESVSEGMAEGVERSQPLAEDAVREMSIAMYKESEKNLDIHSPSGVFKGIGNNIILGLIAGIGEEKSGVLGAVFDIWEEIRNWFSKSVAPKLTAAYWTNQFKSIGDGFKAAIVSGINAGIDAVERGINWIVSELNKIHFSVPEWVPGVGGKEFGFSISSVSIPRLAQGAVIPPNREFMAVLGDQRSGTNIETPLATMVEAFKQAMAESGGMGGGPVVLRVDLDGREIARNTYTNLRQMVRGGSISGLGI